MKRSVLYAVLLAFAVACAKPVEVGAPPRPDAARGNLDPMVSQRIQAALEDAAESPDDPASRGKLGMLYHEHGLPDLAVTTYEQAAALDPKEPRWPYHLAQVSVELGDAERALALYDHVLDLSPDAVQAHRSRGFVLIDLGRAESAESSFRRALELDANDRGARVGLARVELARGNHREVLAIMERLVSEAPEEPYYRQLLGVAHQRMGNLADARANMTQSAGVAPEWRDPWRDERFVLRTGMLAIIRASEKQIAAGRGADAVPALRELLRYRATDPIVMNTLATALLQAGQRAEAEELLLRALEEDPRSFATHANLSHFYETKTPPDLARAMEHALQSVAINPTFASGHLQVGRLQTMQKDYSAAAASLRDALSYGEDDPDVRLMYGRVLAAQQRWSESLRAFQQVIQRRPESAPAFVGIARATMEMGMVDQATRPLRQAQILDPDSDELRRAIDRYRELGGKTR